MVVFLSHLCAMHENHAFVYSFRPKFCYNITSLGLATVFLFIASYTAKCKMVSRTVTLPMHLLFCITHMECDNIRVNFGRIPCNKTCKL